MRRRFIKSCLVIFSKNDITAVQHLANIKPKDVVYEGNVSGGIKGMINGALEKFAKLKLAEEAAGARATSSAGEVGDGGSQGALSIVACVCSIVCVLVQAWTSNFMGRSNVY